MAEDIEKLQRQRAQAEAAGDQAAVDLFDARIEAATPPMGAMDYVSDWGQSLLGGPRRGLESIPATGGDVYDLLNTGQSILRGATAPEQQKLFQETEQGRVLPNSREVEQATEEAYPFLGEHYEPKTRVGRFLNNLGATVFGGGGRHFLREEVLPTVGATVGTEVGAGIGGDAGAQIGALLGAGGTPAAGEGAMRGFRPVEDPAVRRQIRTLQDTGTPQDPLTPIEITGGQALDSPTLKYLEAGPFGNKAARVGDQQARQFTQRALELAGIRGTDRADFATMGAAQDRFGQQYEDLVRRNNGIVMSDPVLQQAMIDAGESFERVAGPGPSVVKHYYDRITEASQQHGFVLPPDVFQQIHSEISADLRRMRNSPELAQQSIALRDMEAALFDAVGRNGQPEIQAQAQALNRQYRNFKILENAMYSTGVDASRGIITPGALASAVKASESKAGFTQGRSDFSDLANAGTLLTPIGNTGSGGRVAAAGVGGGIASGLGMLLSGNTQAGLAAIGGSVAAPFVPAAVSRAVTSRPVRTSLVNRAAGDVPSMWTPLPIEAATPANIGIGARGFEAPVPVEPPPDDEQSMLDVMPVPVDIPPRAQAILRNRGLA